jgi:hypothetical protein
VEPGWSSSSHRSPQGRYQPPWHEAISISARPESGRNEPGRLTLSIAAGTASSSTLT